MKKLIVIALVLLSGCVSGPKADNKARGSNSELILVATTPEGVNVYAVFRNGFLSNHVAVNPKTGAVALSEH